MRLDEAGKSDLALRKKEIFRDAHRSVKDAIENLSFQELVDNKSVDDINETFDKRRASKRGDKYRGINQT